MAEAASPNSVNFFQAMMNPQFAASQLNIQHQQALAQQLMEQGSKEDATAQLANPGGLVVPNSPVAALAKALEKGAGGYLQGKALSDQMNSYYGLAGRQTPDQSPTGQGGAPLLPWQNNALTGQPQGAALGNAMSPDNANSFTPQEAIDEAMQQGRGIAEFKARTAGNIAGAEAGAKAPFDTVTLPDGTVVPKTNIVGGSAPKGNPTVTLQSPAGQQPLGDMYGTQPETNAMPNPIPGVTPGINPNSPQGAANAAGLKAEATKEGENIGDTEKTFNVVSSQLPRAMQRFEQLRKSAPLASYGEGLTPDPDGSPGWKTRYNNQFGDKKTVLANQAIEQIGAQGILPEIGPVIASTGGRGNQFMEKMASAASGIGLPLKPEAKAQAIQNVEDQYIGNMKAQAAILRSHGRPAPTDEQIDAQVAKIKKDISTPSASGNVTHVYQPGKGIVPVGQQ